eukprot:2803160-Alexandrium_andersonii.AAC.1
MQEAPREARRLLRLAVRQGGSPTFADSEPRGGRVGPLGWACWDRGPLGLDFGPRAHFDRTPK